MADDSKPDPEKPEMSLAPEDSPRSKKAQPVGGPATVASSSGPESEPEESSGLHDIKALAETARARNSRRITAQTIDDTVLSASSAGLRAVALPDPSRVTGQVGIPYTSLPSLPSVEMVPNGRPKRPSGRVAASSIAPAVAASSAPTATAAAPAKSRTPLIVGGIAALAVIGGVAFAMSRGGDDAPTTPVAQATDVDVAPLPQVAEPAPSEVPVLVAPVDVAPLDVAPVDVAPIEPIVEPTVITPVAKSGDGDKKPDDKQVVAKADDKVDPKIDAKTIKSDGKTDGKPVVEPVVEKPKTTGGAPTIDDLLASAGGNTPAQDDTPALEKKKLDSSDIKSVMGSFRSAAAACFSKYNEPGNAMVKLSVAPSGKVNKASSTGKFAGTPTGDCVVSAVSKAVFPPWDGSTQTVNYSYMMGD